MLSAGVAEFKKLIALGHADFAHPAIVIKRPPRGHFQIIAILHSELLADDTSRRLRIEFNLGGNDALLVAYRNQADIRLVVSTFYGGRGHFDLLHQLTLVGVHRIELKNHVVRFFRSRRVA